VTRYEDTLRVFLTFCERSIILSYVTRHRDPGIWFIGDSGHLAARPFPVLLARNAAFESLQVHSVYDEPDFSNSKGRARSLQLNNDPSNSNSCDLIHSYLLGTESFVPAPQPRIVISRNNLIRNPHRPCPTAAVCKCHVGWACMSLLLPSSSARPQYYSQFQHSHYPQASYGHYQPYIPPAQTAQAHTPGPVTAAIQRQPSQAANQLDTADVATLNDAIGSAGVDLRVCALLYHPCLLCSRYCHRRKKNRYNAVMTNTKRTAHMKIARGSSPRLPILTRASWELRCVQLEQNTKLSKSQKTP
jgi:hypothetical protein